MENAGNISITSPAVIVDRSDMCQGVWGLQVNVFGLLESVHTHSDMLGSFVTSLGNVSAGGFLPILGTLKSGWPTVRGLSGQNVCQMIPEFTSCPSGERHGFLPIPRIQPVG